MERINDMKIKLIASDLDGTFLTDTKGISPFTKETIARAGEQGICFVPATGRAFSAVPKEVLSLPHTEYVITSNGAAIYSISKKKRVYQCLLNGESVRAVLDLEMPSGVAIEAFLDGVPYSEERYIFHAKDYGATDYGALYVKNTRRPVKDIRTFIKEHYEELDSISFLCADGEKRSVLRRRLEQQVPGIYVTSSVSHMLEIGNADAGKGKTLLYLLKLLGISSEEAMAFGDADNDIDMLAAVKYGIAMKNGTETCKKAAFVIADSNNEDGVAKEIRKQALQSCF